MIIPRLYTAQIKCCVCERLQVTFMSRPRAAHLRLMLTHHCNQLLGYPTAWLCICKVFELTRWRGEFEWGNKNWHCLQDPNQVPWELWSSQNTIGLSFPGIQKKASVLSLQKAIMNMEMVLLRAKIHSIKKFEPAQSANFLFVMSKTAANQQLCKVHA